MDLEQLSGAIIFPLIGIVAGLALWGLGIRLRQRRIKQFAVLLGLMPVLLVGLQFASEYFGWNNPDTFHTSTPGPASGGQSVTQQFPFPVTDAGYVHEIELTPNARQDRPSSDPVLIRFEVQDPKGETIAQGEQTLTRAAGFVWTPLRARFQPRGEIEHKLIIQIPQPVSTLDVKIRELRK